MSKVVAIGIEINLSYEAIRRHYTRTQHYLYQIINCKNRRQSTISKKIEYDQQKYQRRSKSLRASKIRDDAIFVDHSRSALGIISHGDSMSPPKLSRYTSRSDSVKSLSKKWFESFGIYLYLTIFYGSDSLMCIAFYIHKSLLTNQRLDNGMTSLTLRKGGFMRLSIDEIIDRFQFFYEVVEK